MSIFTSIKNWLSELNAPVSHEEYHALLKKDPDHPEAITPPVVSQSPTVEPISEVSSSSERAAVMDTAFVSSSEGLVDDTIMVVPIEEAPKVKPKRKARKKANKKPQKKSPRKTSRKK